MVVILRLRVQKIHKIMTAMILRPAAPKILMAMENSLTTTIPHNLHNQTPSGFRWQEAILPDT
jgi:hypothetical protein